MNTSDWIALAACVAAFIALIPAFAPIMQSRKKGKSEASSRPIASSPDENSGAAPSPIESQVEKKASEPAKLNAFGNALVLSAMALAIGVIELVLFSSVAGLFGIVVDINTMPTNWLIAFYAIFILPGVCLFWASCHLFNLWE